MRKITLIIDQIDHCKTLILRNETVHLRMAFILLDNVAETLMYRKVLDKFVYNEFYERLLEKAKELPPDLFDKFKTECTIPDILEAKRKRRVLQYFDEKLTYLCDTCGLIQKPVATVLSSLHRYRNEIYHRDIIKPDILRPVAILYFEIVCELIVQLQQGPTEYDFADDWTPFFKRHNIPKARHQMFDAEDMEIILTAFRASLAISTEELKTTFRAYLTNRFDNTLKRVEFIRKALDLDSNFIALKVAQFDRSKDTKQYRTKDALLQSQEFKSFQPTIIEASFDRLRQKVSAFDNVKNKINLLNAFKLVEDEFEPIEKIIHGFANDLEAAIDFQSDLARGK
jgi:hypothetical protein